MRFLRVGAKGWIATETANSARACHNVLFMRVACNQAAPKVA